MKRPLQRAGRKAAAADVSIIAAIAAERREAARRAAAVTRKKNKQIRDKLLRSLECPISVASMWP